MESCPNCGGKLRLEERLIWCRSCGRDYLASDKRFTRFREEQALELLRVIVEHDRLSLTQCKLYGPMKINIRVNVEYLLEHDFLSEEVTTQAGSNGRSVTLLRATGKGLRRLAAVAREACTVYESLQTRESDPVQN